MNINNNEEKRESSACCVTECECIGKNGKTMANETMRLKLMQQSWQWVRVGAIVRILGENFVMFLMFLVKKLQICFTLKIINLKKFPQF